MALLSYHASHEQFLPSELLCWTEKAERAGFDGFFSSDHFHPWSDRHGQSGYMWSWMGAALARTTLPGSMVCCPGYRQHLALVAQASATLEEMFPGRTWLALGSGQALNERIVGDRWPAKAERNARLQECAGLIRRLWAGETVTHRGLVCLEEAKLYTRPERPPLLIGAATTETTAEWLGGWADGLLTISHGPAELRRVIEAFWRGGGEGKPLYLKVGLAWDATDAAALHGAHDQWRGVSFPNEVLTEVRCPRDFDEAGLRVHPEDMYRWLRISASLEQHVEWLQRDLELGFQEIILHNINTNQAEFIEAFGAEVLPHLAGPAPALILQPAEPLLPGLAA